MERPLPMDRLVCGDVGFGKTEVAVRAVFKAVQDGYQAAVLVPTTLLASQHAQTFADRYAPFPVRVELLSRFLTNAQARKVLDGLADGSVDVVVGTHRLLGEDVAFTKLGLLVVDEEQRFGVTHKESIKGMSEGVDVLTLTASPIPRTLEMALTGIRDLSMVNTPPAARRPILTYVGEFDEAAASEAIRRELLREGQVFYVHNRVQDIEAVARRVAVDGPRGPGGGGPRPDGRGHPREGGPRLLGGRLRRPGVHHHHRVGHRHAQRQHPGGGPGRPVGARASSTSSGAGWDGPGQRAYAYLFHPADRVLSEQAYERLRTIGDHTELGSGFKIALRDLQIRGAGNLLGRDQSGHIAAIGYDLYVQMVSEAVSELKGEPRAQPLDLKLDLPDAAHLPATYVAAEDVRLEAYRRITGLRTVAEIEDVRTEWEDRFGPLPAPAVALLGVARLRVACLRLGITELAVTVPRSLGGRSGASGLRATVKLSPDHPARPPPRSASAGWRPAPRTRPTSTAWWRRSNRRPAASTRGRSSTCSTS